VYVNVDPTSAIWILEGRSFLQILLFQTIIIEVKGSASKIMEISVSGNFDNVMNRAQRTDHMGKMPSFSSEEECGEGK
jgi:hypothetical protein